MILKVDLQPLPQATHWIENIQLVQCLTVYTPAMSKVKKKNQT